ncbi:MAG: Gldg family protein [Cyclobacteriaceae bacterium]
MKKKNILVQLLIVVAIVIMVNLVATQTYLRLDFTEDNRYTFSDATQEVLDDLNGVVTIKAYFSEDLPSQLLKNRQDFEEQLIEYENRSGGNIVFEFINPNESEETEQKAQQEGISPVMINVTERDQVQQMRAYMGAVLKMDDRIERIPLIQPGAGMEYNLTTAIKKISIVDKPKVGLIQGYGEATMQAIPQLMEQLSVLYDVEPFNISDTSAVPVYYRSLVWLNPADTINPMEFSKIDKYLNQGGGLMIAYSSVEGDLQTAQLTNKNDIGLANWLGKKGLVFGNNFVIDANSATVNVQQRQGFLTINSQVKFPYFPSINTFEDHPITSGLEGIVFPFVSSLTFNNADTAWSQLPLVFSSQQSGIVNPPTYIDIQKKWTDTDFTKGPQILAAGLQKGGANIVVIANGAFCVNGEGQRPQQQSEDNISLASNAVDWIADDTGLIALRTKGITSRPLDQVEESTKNLLKYGNVLAPILLILIYAFVRKQRNVRKRQRWMQGNYN